MNGKSEKVHGKSMLSKVMIPMLILGILEVAVFAIVMLVSGELTYIKKYSYNLLIEKTANRAGIFPARRSTTCCTRRSAGRSPPTSTARRS